MVGAPVLSNPPRDVSAADSVGGPLEGDELAAVVARVAGVDRVSTVARLPEKVLLDDVVAGITEPLPKGVVAFGLAESNLADSPLVPACVDFAETPHSLPPAWRSQV